MHEWKFIILPRQIENWPDLSAFSTNLADVGRDAERVLFYRERNSHRGIHEFSSIRKLIARMVNQEFLEEICCLKQLTYLSLETVTAQNLNSLKDLSNLEILKISHVRNVNDFKPVTEMPNLRGLYIENAKHLTSLEFLSDAHHLTHLGVEGSMWTTQKLASLAPLGGLRNLQYLALTSVSLTDKNLSYLADCMRLAEMDCARFAAKKNFAQLRQLMPELKCHWCDDFEI